VLDCIAQGFARGEADVGNRFLRKAAIERKIGYALTGFCHIADIARNCSPVVFVQDFQVSMKRFPILSVR
jgi:hypothetical protein